MAIAAASEDPRFPPVAADELKDIHIEISVLSKPRAVKSADEVILGKHGVIVSRGYANRGVFLPQVATETGWSKERFLAELCSQKAGLPADCWKAPGTTLEVFTAEVFGEKK
jgi:AmmeMemoRadiSam system protein A